MIFAVTVAVCLTSTPATLCNAHNAVAWISDIEDQQSLAMCQIAGIQEAVHRHLLDATTYPKVWCSMGGRHVVPTIPANAG